MRLNQALQQADDQCLLLFGEVQKAWKSAASLQSDLTDHEAQITKLQLQNTRLSEQRKVDKNQSMQLKTQLAQFIDQEDKHQGQLQERAARIEALEVRCC
jgi:predicted RNase H-like nuclease (RuvC/YqgF family)